jgi:thiol-disulfide isomerase/thioredoxin
MHRAWILVALIMPGLLRATSGDDLINAVRSALAFNNFALAENEIATYRGHSGTTPAVLEAFSWVCRGALAARNLTKAETCATDTRKLVLEVVKKKPLDADRHLPLALGNSIEVQAQVLTVQGRRSEALTFLTQERQTWGKTSLRARIQKNINVLSLEGKLAPPLDVSQWLGPKPAGLAAWRGHAVLLFFWAHWCADCKSEIPDIARLIAEYQKQGLIVVGPTQRYGYVAQGQEADPATELRYIDLIRERVYTPLASMPVPVSEENFKTWGASTTPTLVLLDKKGLVRMYHPGAMPYAELAAQVQAVLKRP